MAETLNADLVITDITDKDLLSPGPSTVERPMSIQDEPLPEERPTPNKDKTLPEDRSTPNKDEAPTEERPTLNKDETPHESAVEIWRVFVESTTLHGLRYIFEKRHIRFRIMWLVMLLTTSGYYILTVYCAFNITLAIQSTLCWSRNIQNKWTLQLLRSAPSTSLH